MNKDVKKCLVSMTDTRARFDYGVKGLIIAYTAGEIPAEALADGIQALKKQYHEEIVQDTFMIGQIRQAEEKRKEAPVMLHKVSGLALKIMEADDEEE